MKIKTGTIMQEFPFPEYVFKPSRQMPQHVSTFPLWMESQQLQVHFTAEALSMRSHRRPVNACK